MDRLTCNDYYSADFLSGLDAYLPTALEAYEGGGITFGHLRSSQSRPSQPPTEASSYEASSASMRFGGKFAGRLAIVIFGPNSSANSHTMYSRPGGTLVDPKCVRTAAHLTICSLVDGQMIPFAGHLELEDTDDPDDAIIYTLGQENPHFRARSIGGYPPTATWTAGYVDAESRHPVVCDSKYSERFGPPHTAYNPTSDVVQVCGFVAVSANQPPFRAYDAIQALDPRRPRPRGGTLPQS